MASRGVLRSTPHGSATRHRGVRLLYLHRPLHRGREAPLLPRNGIGGIRESDALLRAASEGMVGRARAARDRAFVAPDAAPPPGWRSSSRLDTSQRTRRFWRSPEAG